MKFIDRINVDLLNKKAEAQFFVAADTYYLADQFRNNPKLTELVMLEIAVQTAATWLTENLEEHLTANFDLDFLERLYITRRVSPNETLTVQVRIAELASDGESASFNAQARVDGENAMQAAFHLRSQTKKNYLTNLF